MLLDESQRDELLRIARRSVEEGCRNDRPFPVEPGQYSSQLQQDGASFVTLKKAGDLRGCIGALEAFHPLVRDVSLHAFDAAFSDPRFSRVKMSELGKIRISISVLSASKRIQFNSESELIEKIQPGTDGLILEEGSRRGTFLPAVWRSLPDKAEFLKQLKQKAGLPENHWSDSIMVSRYQTLEFSE